MDNYTMEFVNFTMTTTPPPPTDKGPYYRYEYTGIATIITNLIIFVIIVTEKNLRERLPLYAVLAIGDILNGCYFAYANFMRLQQMDDGTYMTPTSKWDCAKKFYSFFQLTGTQFPALIALLISMERVLAVQKPIWYHVKYGIRHRIIAVACCLLILIVSLTVYYLTTYPLTELGTSQYCALTSSSATNYNRAHQAFITVDRICAFILSAFAFIQANKKSREIVAMRKETIQVTPILVVSIFSLLLVSIPQVGLLLTNNFASVPAFNSSVFVHWTLLLTCINSLTNIFIYILFTRDFRRRIIKLITFIKLSITKSTAFRGSSMPARGKSVAVESRHPRPVIFVE